MLVPGLVQRRVGSRIALSPERLDELVAFAVGLELQENVPLERRDDVEDVLVQPFPILFRKLGLLRGPRGREKETGGGETDEDRTAFQGECSWAAIMALK